MTRVSSKFVKIFAAQKKSLLNHLLEYFGTFIIALAFGISDGGMPHPVGA